ncbi:MAG: hypothetical protein FJ125_15815, partial [Deltaproteobacteria bacterium]|nr:hypothetical protein [Deltaproteobacteria bacterium]
MSVLYQTWVKVLLLALLVVLAVTRFYLVRWRRERAGRWLSLAALPVVLLAIVSFNSYGQFWTPRFLNYHDIYHYYFGSKYSDELGYDRLYHCTLLAINETDPRQHEDVVTVRSLVSYQHVAKKWYLDRPQLCRDRFSAQRWAEFKADLVSFRKGRFSSWKEMLKDKGYNPSPVWNMVGRLIAHHVPVQPWQALNVLGSLDLALLGLAMVLAVWGFGWWGAALGIIYLGGCYALTKTHIRGA